VWGINRIFYALKQFLFLETKVAFQPSFFFLYLQVLTNKKLSDPSFPKNSVKKFFFSYSGPANLVINTKESTAFTI
jgi:hypothetical protein